MTTVLDATAQRMLPRAPSRRGSFVLPVVVAWITVTLTVDSRASFAVQCVLGAVTWALLIALLARESPLVRAQTAVVVVFATIVEYLSSPIFGVYLYRLHDVPAYVPPGHGLVYLAALSVGRTAWVHRHQRPLTFAVVAVGGCWAAYGVLLSSRPDLLGAMWFCCLLGFLRWGPSRGLYLGAFLVVSYLELLGTSLGTWAWQPHDPTGLISIGNPPSGAAGGYGWFDLAALSAAPRLLAAFSSLSRRLRPRRYAAPAAAVPVER